MKCVRCLRGNASVVAKAPDGSNAWEVYKCDYCNFCWRTSEPKEFITHDMMDPFFRMENTDITKLMNPCMIPELRKK